MFFMHPIIISIGPLTIYSLGFFILLAVIAGMFVSWKYGRKVGLPDEKVLDLSFISLTWGLIFSRIFYILFHWNTFSLDPGKWFLFLRYPGFSFIGGLTAGIIAVFIYCKIKKENFLLVADILSIGLALGTIIGQIGVFLDGSDVGLATKWIIGINNIGYPGSRFPVSLIGLFLNLIVFIILIKLFYKSRISSGFIKGTVFAVFLVLEAGTMFAVDLLRQNRLYFLGIPITIIFTAGTGLFLLFLFRPGKRVKYALLGLARQAKITAVKLKRNYANR